MSSTGLITISQRLRGITEVGEDGAVATSKLAEKFKEIANIDIFDQYGQLRDTYSILEDMSRVFPTLTKNQRQYLSELAAGKKQVKVLESLLTNWSGVEKATKAAANSAGSAERENAKYIDSIVGKSKALESSIQKLATTTIDSDFIKWILDVTKGLVDFQDSIGGLLPLVSTLVLLFSSKLAPALDSVFKILKTSVVGMKAQQTAAIAAAAGTEVLGVEAQKAATRVAVLQKGLGWLSLALTVISIGVGLWNDYTKAQEEARIESIEAGNAIAEESSSLDELYSSIKDLSSIQDRTEEQESNLLQLNSDIIAKLGDRKVALENLTIGSKEYTEALKNQIIEEAKSNEASLRKSKTDAEQALKSDIPSRGFLAAPLKISNEDLGKDLRNQLVEIFNESSKTSAGKWFDFYVDRVDSSAVATLQFYDDLLKAKKAIEAESDALDHAGKDTEAANLLQTESYSELNKEIARYSEYVDDYLKATLNVEINNRRINGTLPTTVEEFEAFRAEMLKNYGVLGEYSDEFGAFIDSAFSGLSGKVGDANWKLEESNKVVEDATTKTKLLSDQIDALQSAYKTLESVIDEYNKTGNLSLDSVQSILALGDEYLQYLTNENGQLMLNEEGLQNLAVARLNELKASAMQETASKLQYLIDEKELTDGTTESVKALTEAEIEALVVQAGSSEEALALLDAMRLRVSLIDELISDTEILGNTTEEYSEKIKTATEKYDEQNSALDEAQSAYETLTSAIDDYNKTGVLSVDTLQSLLALSPEYLQMYFNQATAADNAKNAIYSQAQALQIAKIQELQAAAANDVYLYSIGKTSEMSPLAQAAIGGVGTAYGGLAASAVQTAAQTALSSDSIVKAINKIRETAGLSPINPSDLTAGMNNIINSYRNIANSIASIDVGGMSDLSSATGRAGKAADTAADSYKDLLSVVIKMIEQEVNDKIDALDAELKKQEELKDAAKDALKIQLEGYKKLISVRKKALESLKDEKDYNDDLAEKTKSVSDIQSQLDEISFDTSESAAAKKLGLQEDLSKAQKELDDYQYDHQIELQEDALDNEEDAYEESIENQEKAIDDAFELVEIDYEKRIQKLKDYLEKDGLIRQAAIDLIEGKTAAFYKRLFDYNKNYGDMTQAELQSLVNSASIAGSSIKKSMGGGAGATKKLGEAAGDAATQYDNLYNSAQRFSELLSRINAGNGLSVDSAIAEKLYLKKYETHHSGLDSGFVGDKTSTSGNEMFIKALKGEVLVNPSQQNRFVDNVLPSMLSNSGSSVRADNLISINVSGNLDSSVVPELKKTIVTSFESLTKTLASRGIIRTANNFQ